jgi:ketosteroid isomerase-like protein
MPRPLGGDEIGRFIATALSAAPDFRLEPVRWCARDDTLFVEAATSGTVRGRPAAWAAIYCVTLRGDRVLRGRSYYDRAAVSSRRGPGLAHVDIEKAADDARNGEHLASPELQANLIEPYIAGWRDPQPERLARFYAPIGRLRAPDIPGALSGDDIAHHYRTQLAEMDELQRHCQTWAGRPGQAFFEWRMTGAMAGRPFDIGGAERLTLDGCRIAESVSYFDTLALAAVRDPSVAPTTVFDTAR